MSFSLLVNCLVYESRKSKSRLFIEGRCQEWQRLLYSVRLEFIRVFSLYIVVHALSCNYVLAIGGQRGLFYLLHSLRMFISFLDNGEC